MPIMSSKILTALVIAGAALAAPTSSSSPLYDRQACSPATNVPSVTVNNLPDPFVFSDGTRVTTKAQWTCRQEEILNAFEQYELGDLPPAPTALTASISGNSLSISITVASGNKASFSVSISGASTSSPGPAIIAYGFPSIPIPAGVATITFNNDNFAAQNGGGSRGQGLFYTLHGNSHSAGALTAWAWGVARIIDALEQLGAAKTGIDPARVGVTGCSRNGKGAFVAGALDKRVALTIPQESGAGGAACWRISDLESAAGKNIQTARQIVGENVWFSTRFNSWTQKITTIPYDHHLLAGLVAPRGLYIPENTIDWLGPVSIAGCMRAGKLIYGALGVPENMGISVVGGHGHCSFPATQNSELTQFINYFLLKSSTKPTNLDRSDANVDVKKYIDWTAPTLT
jgi:hypothetical protein